MAWIESHQKLQDHPKMLQMALDMNWNEYECIGRLHCLWWWCVDHCEDGDLRRYSELIIARAAGVAPKDAMRFIEAAVKAEFFERNPYFRLVNWWKYVRRFMQKRFEREPAKWKRIESLYDPTTKPAADTVVEPTEEPTSGRVREPATIPTVEHKQLTVNSNPNLNSSIAKSAKRRAGENEALQRLEKLLSANDMTNWGGTWRLRFRENPEKFNRVWNGIDEDIKNGKEIEKVGGYANDLWKRLP